MLPGKAAADPAAVWRSNREAPTRTAVAAAARRSDVKRKTAKGLPDFIAPQLCISVERPPNEPGWAHEVKFDGYRVQLRILGGTATLKTRKGLDWTDKFKAIAAEAAALPDGIIDGEIVALDDHGAPNFAALQAALSEGRTDDLIFYGFDLLCEGDTDLRRQPL